ncbi:flavodoxin family protein [Clostridium sp. 'deep sea']|uniref:flavodoxin family protein n=1 Tax=Clostridium sp. 'deep sea' TaxID=2779445 RepID=UPI0018966821|nr:flavodoxin family protein [Clostridium sp. 'deep sea']QOR36318.1 flavodoxin family protein [Clostridium sp. 'deep sea']
MKVIAFAGSPRINGNSDLLLNECLKAAREKGAEVEKIYLDLKVISPCKACDFCRSNGHKCIINDDMQLIYRKLQEADVWIIATPIYWWGPSAQLKLMVDRWYSFYKAMDCSNKKVALLITMGDTKMKVAQPTIDMFDMAFTALGIKQLKPLVISAHKKGEILQNKEALKQAYEIGLSF